MQVPFCSLKSISVLDILKCTDAIGIPNPYFTDYSNKTFLNITENNGCLSLSQPSITYNKQLVRFTLDLSRYLCLILALFTANALFPL